MNETAQPSNYNIGWDVGGWNCDKNPRSRDAIVILDAERRIHGTPWRGNLREKINAANTTDDWIEALFELCGVDHPGERLDVVLAIDTPLGFSAAMLGGMGSFKELVTFIVIINVLLFMPNGIMGPRSKEGLEKEEVLGE